MPKLQNKEAEMGKEDGIRVKSAGNGSLSLENLTREEIENLEGMVHNHFWVTVGDNGRLETVRRRELLPSPVEDEEMTPFWRRPTSGTVQMQLLDDKTPPHSMPSIIIQHLCGYGYTLEGYRYNAQLLEGYGFECLRSRRGNDARFTEVWLLPGLWFAEGDLKEELGEKKDKKALDAAVNFLCRNVQFGTLDISCQRAAMAIE